MTTQLALNPLDLDDLAARYTAQAETAATSASSINVRPTDFVLVADVEGKKVTVVAPCTPRARGEWFETLGLSPDVVDDIDANWGTAWQDANGAIHTAGPNLLYAEEALLALEQYQLRPNGLSTITEDPATETLLAFVTSTPDDGDHEDLVLAAPQERAGILELFGLRDERGSDTGDPWGMVWRTHDGAYVVAGNDTNFSLDAFGIAIGWFTPSKN